MRNHRWTVGLALLLLMYAGRLLWYARDGGGRTRSVNPPAIQSAYDSRHRWVADPEDVTAAAPNSDLPPLQNVVDQPTAPVDDPPEEEPGAAESEAPAEDGLAPYPAWNGRDLDCPDIRHAVRVDGPDPHGLDRDGDGVGCESWQ
jgi:hypothetical protein